MPKIQHQHTSHYTIIDNKIINDRRLKIQDLGLFLFMWSKPDNWTFSIRNLVNLKVGGESKIRTSLKRLCELGYIRRTPGQGETIYELDDRGEIYDSTVGEITTVKTTAVNSTVGETTAVKTPTYNNKEYSNKRERVSTEEKNSSPLSDKKGKSKRFDDRTDASSCVVTTEKGMVAQAKSIEEKDALSGEKEKASVAGETQSVPVPTKADVEDFILSRDLNVDPNQFWDYFTVDGEVMPANWKRRALNWSYRERRDLRAVRHRQEKQYQQATQTVACGEGIGADGGWHGLD